METEAFVDGLARRGGLQPGPLRSGVQAIGDGASGDRGAIPVPPMCRGGGDVEDRDVRAKGDSKTCGHRSPARLAQVAACARQAQKRRRHQLLEHFHRGFKAGRGQVRVQVRLSRRKLSDRESFHRVGGIELTWLVQRHQRDVFASGHIPAAGKLGETLGRAWPELQAVR